MEKENKNIGKGVFVLITLLVLIILCLVGYICYDKEIIFNKAEEKKFENTKVVGTDDNKIVDDSVETKNEVKELDLSKSLNTTGVTYSEVSDTKEAYGLSMRINDDKKSITLSIDWNVFGPLSRASAFAKVVEDYQITGFSKNVKETFVGLLGQDSVGITLFYLMDDGTVEYTSMFIKEDTSYIMNYSNDYSSDGKVSNSYFKTMGTVNGVKNVIKLYNVSASNGFGWRTSIGATANGSFYDLGDIISR